MARNRETVTWHDDLKNLAAWTYFQGGTRLAGNDAGNIIVEAIAPGWFWMIPFSDNTCSIGYVAPSAWFAESGSSPEQLMHDQLAKAPFLSKMLEGATEVAQTRTARDWSYHSTEMSGPGFIKLISGLAKAVMMVPFPDEGKWRLVDTRDVDYDRNAGHDKALAVRFARKIQAGTGAPVTVEPPTWVSVFTIQQRMVPAMRSGRCFVAGDAAHVHSPASGQGLNTGIQEACNLAWKLADVQHGRAAARLLDGYDAERVPVGAPSC